jgi:hypothetical protein
MSRRTTAPTMAVTQVLRSKKLSRVSTWNRPWRASRRAERRRCPRRSPGGAHRVRLGGGAQPRHLPVGPVLPARPTHREEEGGPRGGALDPRDRLAPARHHCTYQDLGATTSSGATPIVSVNGPSPSSKLSATASSSNRWRCNTQDSRFRMRSSRLSRPGARGFGIRSVVSSVSATEPCEPTQDSTRRLLTRQPTWYDMVSGEAPYGPVCWCHWDGMQGVRGSSPLSSTRHNASSPSALSVVCQRFARKRRPWPLEHSAR